MGPASPQRLKSNPSSPPGYAGHEYAASDYIRGRSEVVNFGSRQGPSVFVTAVVVNLRRGLQRSENAAWGRKAPLLSCHERWSESPVSRILFPAAVTRIRGDDHSSYGFRLPGISCDLPGSSGGQPSDTPLFGLAPGGVYKAFPVTRKTGTLLPHRFTLTFAP